MDKEDVVTPEPWYAFEDTDGSWLVATAVIIDDKLSVSSVVAKGLTKQNATLAAAAPELFHITGCAERRWAREFKLSKDAGIHSLQFEAILLFLSRAAIAKARTQS